MTVRNDAPFVISRRYARQIGLSWYFEKPCFAGHLAKRMIANKNCLECHRLRRARFRAAEPEKIKASKAESYLRHREEVIAAVTAYQASRPAWNRARRARYRAKRRLKSLE